QVVQYLDGPSVSIERRSPVGRLAWTEDSGNGGLSSPARWAAHLEEYYQIDLEEDARVAGRDAVKLIFEPLDQWRFAHEWWLDRETGLLLKHVLIDQQGRIIET
ncbi:sigma-E factor regulatory protein RseB domain-containing protein, partial [Microbacterium sp. JB110]